MNIPEIFFSNDPNTFFILIVSLSIVSAVLILIIIFQIYSMYSLNYKVSNLIDDNKKRFYDVEETLSAYSMIISRLDDNFKKIIAQKNNNDDMINELKSEVTRIADGISGQDTMTKAIELARRGSSINDIISSTGISKSEAEALIKFHQK